LDNGGNKDLDLEVEHVVVCDRFADFKEILLPSPVVVIDQETARVPVVVRVVEHFKLDECRLAGLNRRVILVPWSVFLFWNVFYFCQILDRRALIPSEHSTDPGAPARLLFGDAGKFDVVLEADVVLFTLFVHLALLHLLVLLAVLAAVVAQT